MKKNRLAVVTLSLLAPYMSSCHADLNDRGIIVATITKTVDESRPGYEICNSFVLAKEDVVTYFSTAEEVDEHEFNQVAIILPCKYTGIVEIRGEQFYWEISAGGAGYLYRNRKVNKRYLCKTNCCNALPDLC